MRESHFLNSLLAPFQRALLAILTPSHFPLTQLKWQMLSDRLTLPVTTNPEDRVKSLNFKNQESYNADKSNSVSSYFSAS